jgi:hypothetical protein
MMFGGLRRSWVYKHACGLDLAQRIAILRHGVWSFCLVGCGLAAWVQLQRCVEALDIVSFSLRVFVSMNSSTTSRVQTQSIPYLRNMIPEKYSTYG